MPRVQRGIRVLEDHLHLAAQLGVAAVLGGGEFKAFQGDIASRGVYQPAEAPGQRRLPAARLADEPEHLAPPHLEGDAGHRLNGGPRRLVGLHEVLDPEQHRPVGRRRWRCRLPLARRYRGHLVVVVASTDPPVPRVVRWRRLDVAAFPGDRAAGGVHASRQVGAQRRQGTGDGVQTQSVLAHAAPGHAAQKPQRVGVTRLAEELVGRTLFDEAPGVEHAHPLTHATHDGEVVADEQDGGVEVAAQLLYQIQHLGLDGRV